MARYALDEEQCEAIYRALKGDANESTLLKTKKLLELQGLRHGVLEVQQQLVVLQGTGMESPGLLRMFNPQHDMLVDAEPKGGSKKKQDDTRDMFADAATGSATENAARAVGGVDAGDQTPATPVPIEWADDVPTPRPEVGQTIMQPSGATFPVREVLGYEAERSAFRVTGSDGWDGYVFPFGKRDALAWRVLSQALDYPDASDEDTEPQGSVEVIAADLRERGTALLAGPALIDDDTYGQASGDLVYLLPLLNSAVNPEYLGAYIHEELRASEDNAHGLGRLLLQHADMVAAANEDHGAELAGALADETDDETGTTVLADETDEDTTGYVEGLTGSTDDAADEQALAEGLVPDGAEDADDARAAALVDEHEAEQGVESETLADPSPLAVASKVAPKVSPQRARNAAQAGIKKAVATAPAKAPAKKAAAKHAPATKHAPAKAADTKSKGKPSGRKGRK